MIRQTGSKVCILGLAFAALVVAKPPPAGGPWASYGKPAFARSLGPPAGASGMSSITVPYMPKGSPFFPKLVDPKTMISKKTDLLSNLFGGLGPVDASATGPNDFAKYPPGFGPFSPLYATSTFEQAAEPEDLINANEIIASDKIKRAASPGSAKAGGAKASKSFGPKFSPFAPDFSPFAPKFSPFAPQFSPFAPKISPFAPNFSPFAPKTSPFAPKFSPFAPNFSPFAPNAAPAGPNFAPTGPNYAPANYAPSAPSFPFPGYPSKFGFYDTDSSSRRRRSIVGAEGPAKALGPPPAYPGLAPIAEESDSLESRLQKLSDPANAPKLSLPGMFGPFGPFSPYGPAAGYPASFGPKKPSFLDAYYQSLATASPVETDAPVTEVPIPKSTIVPPGFWAPSGIIPGPTEYTDKVASFLDKLFTSLALNKTAAPATPMVTRALINAPVDSGSPKLGVAGKFGPFSPYGPAFAGPFGFGPKKPSFFDTLYQSPAFGFNPSAPVTEVPVPKSTIVPPGFWAPSSIIPGPTEYNDKVASFLDKLFTSLVFNKTAPAGTARIARALTEDPEQAKVLVSRSLEDVKKIAIAKDDIVDSILAEMGELKTDMIDTLNDFFAYSKTLPVGKKPFKPMSPFAAFFAPPTPDPSIPFKQRMLVLSQVFDMLSGIQKNITIAVQDAIKSSTDAPVSEADSFNQDSTVEDPNASIIAAFNATLVDAIKNRLASLDQSLGTGYNKPIGSFYAGPAKRDVEDEDYYEPEYYENQEDKNHEHYKRAVQMQMHQGYQSMPPGTVETVEAGGGTVPGHQGGGIKLLDSENNDYDWEKWSEWADYFKNENEGRNHHHNHH